MIRYEKTIWENDKTPVNAQHLSKVEDGLEYLFDVIKDVPAGEDSRIANEKQRQVNETTRQNNELKRNDTLNAKVKEVDNAIIASNNNIKEVNNKFETIVASKQQDAEVILARDGEVSLGARLERDLKKGKTIYETVEGSYLSIDDTLDSYLQNVEIKGNTIQNPNDLADIKSVGDKVGEQELYKIPILVNHLNLNPHSEQGGITSTGEENSYESQLRSGFIRVAKGNTYHWRFFNGNNLSGGQTWLTLYNSDKTFKSQLLVDMPTFESDFNGYIRLNRTKGSILEIMVTVNEPPTQFEKYQEYKLDILSPCQLEKVGDIADRIIEKDGVWGIEKNIVTTLLLNNMNWFEATNSSGIKYFYTKDILQIGVVNRQIMCDNLRVNTGINQDSLDGYNQILVNKVANYSDRLYIALDMSTEEFKTWLDNNPTHIKYVDKTQFMPLPHAQQVELRTFANQTNISFLTETEGTIKSDVPKSLGASVNSNTKAIQDLNKDLEKVKKLEEATTTTFTTESDFVAVEETKNGYFESIKLKGKTFVNRLVGGNAFGGNAIWFDNNLDKLGLKDNKEYTVVFDVPAEITKFAIYNTSSSNAICNQMGIKKTFKFNYLSSKGDNKIFLYSSTKVTSEIANKCKVMLLEGNYTQNPPNYFEGMKSVGDDVEEIVVSTDNNVLADNYDLVEAFIGTGDGKTFKNDASAKNTRSYIFKCPSSSKISIERDKISTRFTVATSNTYPRNDDKLTLLSISGNSLKTVVYTPANAKYMIIYVNDDITKSDICKLYASAGDVVVKKEKKTDIKKVLYYDIETQTWKNPILHEWDSIEKHDNGKYYYHQRSNKRVYQSGDEDNFKVITDKANTVYKLDEEKVFECTPIDLQSFEGKTNYQINSGPISPKSTLKYVNYIGNVINTLKEKVSNLEDKLYNTNLANFTVALNALDTKLKLEQLTKTPR